MSTHESFKEKTNVQMGSDKAFGITFGIIFAIIGSFPILHGNAPKLWLYGLGLLFALLAYTNPGLLTPLNKLWFRFGMLLHKVINPLIMGIIYFVFLTPMGLIMRLTGKKFLKLKPDAEAKTYWVERDPAQTPPETLKNQF